MKKNGSRPPTLKTIAELTGLSLSTVSLSLRDGRRLKQETRDRVAAAAAQVGYVPNRAGVRLRTGQTNVLALVLAPEQKTIDYTRRLIEGIGAYIVNTKFHLNVIPEFEQDNATSAVRYIMENRTADGIILTHTRTHDPRIKLMLETDFPFVTHGRTEFPDPHPFVDFRAERGAEMVVHRLVEQGRKRLLLVVMDNQTTDFLKIVEGFKGACHDLGIEATIMKDPKHLASPKAARAFGNAMAASGVLYDGIFCNNELTALAILGGLSASGLTMGDDFDMICKQTTSILPSLQPDMDTVAEDLFSTGQDLARVLIEAVQGAPVDQLQQLKEPIPSWISS